MPKREIAILSPLETLYCKLGSEPAIIDELVKDDDRFVFQWEPERCDRFDLVVAFVPNIPLPENWARFARESLTNPRHFILSENDVLSHGKKTTPNGHPTFEKVAEDGPLTDIEVAGSKLRVRSPNIDQFVFALQLLKKEFPSG